MKFTRSHKPQTTELGVPKNFSEVQQQGKRFAQFRKELSPDPNSTGEKHPQIILRNKPGVKPGKPIDEVRFMGGPPPERSALHKKKLEQIEPKKSPLDLRKF